MERKLATILFADLVGSTALGGELDPEYTRDLLERFYDAMEAEIALGGGTVEKFIGDAVVAVFGAPAAQEDHAERALQTSLWMLERLRELFADRLSLRIGVNSGEVVVGRPREGSSFATGDAVNVAARLEQAAAPGQVLVGERTAALVGDAFELGEARTVEAKGKEGGVTARELRRMVAPRRPRGGHGLASTFVGRARELAWLQELASTDEPRFAQLVGEPGLGKTTLVRELQSRLPAGTAFRLGRCLSYGRSVTYSPLAAVLRQELGLREEDAALERLAGREILGLTLGLDVAGELEPRAAVLALQDAWVRLVSEIGARGRTVLVLEDLHWAAEPLIELLARVLSDATGPVLILGTTRPGRAGLPAGETLTLEPLGDHEAAELIDEALAAPLDAAGHEFVLRHAEGNPFFVEELLSDLIDRELLRRRNGGWALNTSALSIPDSIQGVLAARIDLLPPTAKDALQAAAVIGRSFSPAAVTALVGSAAEVRTLVEHGFVRATEPELVFKHALTRDVAYGSLPKAERARRHAAHAEWLEGVDASDARAGTLAYHYAEAVNPEIADLAWRDREEDAARLRIAALRWLRRAAELAVGRFDLDDAVGLLGRAAELAPADPELWHSIGRVNALKFDGEAFWEAMLKAVESTSEAAALGELYGELSWESTMRGAMWKVAPDDAIAQGWITRALELAPPDSRPYAYALTAKAMREDDVPAADRAVAVAERLDDVELLSFALFTHFAIAQAAADFTTASEWARRRLGLARRLNDPDHLALIHWGSSTAELALGHLQEAASHAHRHEAIAARLTPHHEVHALGNLLTLDEAAGRWDRLHARTERTERVVAANAATPCVYSGRSLLACATACAALGLDDEARRLEAEESALGFEGYEMWLDALRARLALIRGDLDRVEELIDGSEKWCWPIWNYVNGVTVRLDAFVALGRAEEVAEVAERHALPGTYLEPFALRTLGVARGDATLVAQAQERFAAMGLDWYAAQTRELGADVVG
ncbi:MAG TPA: adenylate/guanylate cyclase domain-containing protein [Gaiellaceae bacterium]|nr:adenylate/guanylate cyclase domain-containing protein [Gaiellaceae bacterium]